MKNKRKNTLNNRRGRGGVIGYLGNGIIVFGTVTGAVYSSEYLRDKFGKPKKLQYVNFDDDVIEEVINMKKKALKKGIELDFDETLNELQRNKNIKKDD